MQHSWYEQNNKLYSYCLILILGAESGKTDLPISWFTTRLICFVIYSLLMWQGRHSLSGRYKIFSHLTTLIYVNRYLSQKLDKIIEDNHVWQKSETKKSKNQNSVPLKIQAARLCHTTLLFWARNSCINFAASIYKKKKWKMRMHSIKRGCLSHLLLKTFNNDMLTKTHHHKFIAHTHSNKSVHTWTLSHTHSLAKFCSYKGVKYFASLLISELLHSFFNW